MAKSLKKRGQKAFNKLSRISLKVSREGNRHLRDNLIRRLSHIQDIKLLILEWGLLSLALIMLAITQAIWFSDSYADTTFVSGGAYTEATVGEVNSMNPLFAETNSEKVLSRLMFATLATNDYSGNIAPGLAKSITSTENGRVWNVKLRDELKWSDGEPITNDDVIYTTEIIKNPGVDTIYDANLKGVEVSENEEGEIVFKLPSVYADFISALDIPILPKHILEDTEARLLIENAFSRSPITSGAFNFNALQSKNSEKEKIFYLTANPYYYGGRVSLNSFIVHTYPNKESVIEALNSGAATATAELSEIDKDKVSSVFLRRNSSIKSGVFIFFNLSNGLSRELGLRSAIRQGIDLDKLRQEAPETTALDYPLLSSQIKLSNYPPMPTRNFEEAKKQIEKISDGDQIKLNIATANSGFLPKVATALGEELGNLGINTSVSVYEEDQNFITNIIAKKNYDILVYEIELGASPDPLPYYHSSQSSGIGLNLSGYRNYIVDDLLLGARDTTDMALRIKKYESFLSYWIQDIPAIALYQPNLTYYYNKNIRTFSPDIRLVTAIDRFCDVGSWAVNSGRKNKTP